MKTQNKITHAERLIILSIGDKALTRQEIINKSGVSLRTFHLFLKKFLKLNRIEILNEKKENKKLYKLTR